MEAQKVAWANLKSSMKVMVLGIGKERHRQLLGREKLMSKRGEENAFEVITMIGKIQGNSQEITPLYN